MPYTGNPATFPPDAVRVLVGDTDPDKPLLDDPTYDYIVGKEKSDYARGALAASMLAGKYGHQYTKRVGSLWREAKTLYLHFKDLAQWFRLESARRGSGAPFAGGINVAEVQLRREDSTLTQPAFEVGMQDSMDLPEESAE